MQTLDSLTSDASDVMTNLLRKAFEAGRAVGREEAAVDLKTRIGNLLSANQGTTKAKSNGDRGSDQRAMSGSVKPTIAKMVANATQGLTAREIEQATGFKANTIRGTLWTLGQEGAAQNRGGRWFPVAKNASAAESNPEREAPAAS